MEGLKTWITRIAVNRAIDYKRKQMRRPESIQDRVLIDVKRQTSVPAAEAEAIQAVHRQHIRQLVEQLPANYREVVSAYYLEGKSYEQIAAETGIEMKSVESRLYRARNWIKRRWRREDFE
jgi:RNA polymerase sigma factor (sigma-70 family)